MAVVLMESPNVIGAVRSLTNWYGVMAETSAIFCGVTLVETRGHSKCSSSAGATGSVGRPSFLTVRELTVCLQPEY